ncbi:MAG: DUF3015 domain-containing protein [Gammaproteobacteria bacterium]|nr:DUF3015 domain-containing protein [Gammaproteobacteria bacterium]
MLKKATVLSAAILIGSMSSVAVAGENGGGCGPGKIVMEGKSGKNAHIVVSLINIVINYFVPVQFFAMTTGTLGCDNTQVVSNDLEKERFLAGNADNLTIDIARGEGEHLNSLATIIGVSDQDKPVFYSTLQDNFENIIVADNMMASIDSTMMGNPQLEKYVQ